MDQYLEKIQHILEEVKEQPGAFATISDETNILEDIGLDSIQMIAFLLKIEETFEIEIDFETLELEDIQTIHQLRHFIRSPTLC